MCYSEEQNKKLLYNFELLGNVIRPKSTTVQFKADLSKIEEIINNKIQEVLKGNAPEDIYTLYTDFKAEYERFREFLLYDKIIGKNIVALGGGFSSGKSSFLNYLLGKKILPARINSSTSVPTYIVKGDDNEVIGINAFDSKVIMQQEDIRKVAKGFGEIENDDDEQPSKFTDAVTLGHILRSIFFSTPLQNYDNVAFLDTPGYSNSDSETYSIKTDEQIARGQLNSSNYILWFISAEDGTITPTDIDFIKSLRSDIPKLIIVSKADKKSLNDLTRIIKVIKEKLINNNINYIDILAFTNKKTAEKEKAVFFNNELTRIKSQIEKWNQQTYQPNFAKNFKRLFIRCNDYYVKEKDKESRDVGRLNSSLTKLIEYENIDKEIVEPLENMVKEKNKTVEELKKVINKVKDLQKEFYTGIEIIGDKYNIDMSEPSDLDVITEGVKPLQLFKEYNEKHGIRIENDFVDLLQNTFSGINPVINQCPGGSEYKNELLSILLENCNVAPEDIRIPNARSI